MPFYSADYILPISSAPIKDGVVHLDDNGVVIKVGSRDEFPTADMKHLTGVLVPGFVNAHCHLELSHMQSLCDTGTGLISFIGNVVKLRDFEEQIILDAIARRDEEMYAKGIQAVGDICNKLDTAKTKTESPIHYYSFVEMFDMMQTSRTEETINMYQAVYNGQSDAGHNSKSFVPHAPYSVSKGLFEFINNNNSEDSCISIHNQETPPENELFENGTGAFHDFYASFGMNLNEFKALGKSAIHYVLQNLKPRARNLFVHNTLTNSNDIASAHAWSDNCYWVSCPNANLYIENSLPDYKCFLDANAKVCLGTDSIMSNWQLDIWEEVKTIKKYNSYVPIESLLQWACLNGAKALKYEDIIGSIEPGKSPGLVHIDMEWRGALTDISKSKAVRIA